MGIKLQGRFLNWGDITLQLLDNTLIDGTEIDYSDEMGVNRSQGQGRGTRGYSQGQYTGSGSVGMRREAYNRLEAKASAAGGFYNIKPFPITITYRDENDQVVTDTLTHCKFKKRDFKAAEKDEFLDVKLEFEILGEILTNGVPAY